MIFLLILKLNLKIYPKIVAIHFEVEFKNLSKDSSDIDPYEVLGVSKDASFEEIKASYRRLSREYHPDFTMDKSDEIITQATKKMQQINEAYDMLKAKFK